MWMYNRGLLVSAVAVLMLAQSVQGKSAMLSSSRRLRAIRLDAKPHVLILFLCVRIFMENIFILLLHFVICLLENSLLL